jgi:steroid Delta-isomerase
MDAFKTVKAFFTAIRSRDKTALLATFGADAEMEDPAGSPPKRGAAEIGAFFEAVAGMLTRMDFVPEHIHVCGDRAAASWRAELAAANGLQTTCRGIDVFEFDTQGRIAKVTGYWDPAGTFAALGLG